MRCLGIVDSEKPTCENLHEPADSNNQWNWVFTSSDHQEIMFVSNPSSQIQLRIEQMCGSIMGKLERIRKFIH